MTRIALLQHNHLYLWCRLSVPYVKGKLSIGQFYKWEAMFLDSNGILYIQYLGAGLSSSSLSPREVIGFPFCFQVCYLNGMECT